MAVAQAIIVAAYGSLAIELLVLAVPSAVSTTQLCRRSEAQRAAAKARLIVPVALIVLLFLIPPAAAFAPELAHDLLIPISALQTPWVLWSGIAALVFGRIWTLFSLFHLRRVLPAGDLARKGPFAYSRHPLLLGMFVFYLGNALALPSAILFAGFPLYLLQMHGRVLLEEAELRERFPLDYPAYAARVPRYLGARSA